MVSDVLKVGNKIELVKLVSNDDILERKTYLSQICDNVDENNIYVLMPVMEGKLVPLPQGGRYEAYITTSKGMYSCDVVVTNRFKNDNIYMLSLEIVTDIRRFQRREYFRLEVGNQMLFKPIDDDEMEYYVKNKEIPASMDEKPVCNAVTLDISGGGIRYVTKDRNNKNDNIFISIRLAYNSGVKEFNIIGKVLSTTILPNRANVYEERVEFSAIPKEDREEIIKYIFEEERKRRQKERG